MFHALPVAHASLSRSTPLSSALEQAMARTPDEIRCAARTVLMEALEKVPDLKEFARQEPTDRADPHIEGIADTLLLCINGSSVDFQQLQYSDAILGVQNLPPEGWAALQQHAQADGGDGIASLTFHMYNAGISSEPEFAQAMEHLPDLEYLGLPVLDNMTESIDLSGLRGVAPRLRNVVLTGCFHNSKVTVTVPSGMSVRGQPLDDPKRPNAARIAKEKSIVKYVDARGNPIAQAHTLDGVNYDRSATVDFGRKARRSGRSAQELARMIRLNGKVVLRKARGQIPAEQAWCGHIVHQWLVDQRRHDEANAGARLRGTDRVRFSYKPYKSAEALDAHFDKDVVADTKNMLSQGAATVFETSFFGELLASQFKDMETGESALFSLSSHNHVMGLKLRVKESFYGGQAHRKFAVIFYDPNSTAKHHRIVVDDPRKLKSIALDVWLGKKTAEHYFGKEEKFGSLHNFARERAAIRPGRPLVSSQALASPMYLYTAVLTGHDEATRQSVDAILSQWPGLDSDAIEERLLARGTEDTQAFIRGNGEELRPAMAYKGAAAVAYAAKVLWAPEAILDDAAKRRLMAAVGKKLHRAAIATALAREVFAAPEPDSRKKWERLALTGLSADKLLAAFAKVNDPRDRTLIDEIRSMAASAA